jgi:hypothetical protein
MITPIQNALKLSRGAMRRASGPVETAVDTAAAMPPGRPFFVQLRMSSAKFLRATLRPDTFNYLRGAFRRSLRMIGAERRLSFPLLYPADYKLAKQGYDVVFLLYAPQLWPNIKLVVNELRSRHPDLRLGMTFCGPRDKIPDYLQAPGVTIICNFVAYSSYALNTKIIYTPHPILDEFMSSFHRPRGAKLICAPYSLNTIDGTFTEDAFDMYDYILCQGPDHIVSFQKLALNRPALSGTKLVPAGYPKLDLTLAMGKQRPARQSTKTTVVYAPTHAYLPNENLTSLLRYGESIVNALLTEGYRVIFRPHGASLSNDDERPVVQRIRKAHAGDPDFSFDGRDSYTDSYSLADLMVTDLSGTGFSFGFGFGKPAIFFAPDANAEQGMSGLQFEGRDRIGALVRNVDQLIRKASELRQRNMAAEIEQFRSEAVYNVGDSAAYISTCLEDILSGRDRPEMVQL